MRFKDENDGTGFAKSRRSVPLWMIVGAVICVLAVVATVVFMRGGFSAKSNESVVKRVGKHIMLPNETPEVTTVDNAAAMTGQPFFANVKNGDKILIFPKAMLIIVYRPSEDILVNGGPIVDDSSTGSSSIEAAGE